MQTEFVDKSLKKQQPLLQQDFIQALQQQQLLKEEKLHQREVSQQRKVEEREEARVRAKLLVA